MAQEILMLLRHAGATISHLCRCVQGPAGVGEMGSGQADQIRSARRNDAIDVIDFIDVADRNSRDSSIVADDVGQGGLEHASGLGFGSVAGLSRGDVDDVSPRIDKGPGNQ